MYHCSVQSWVFTPGCGVSTDSSLYDRICQDVGIWVEHVEVFIPGLTSLPRNYRCD